MLTDTETLHILKKYTYLLTNNTHLHNKVEGKGKGKHGFV